VIPFHFSIPSNALESYCGEVVMVSSLLIIDTFADLVYSFFQHKVSQPIYLYLMLSILSGILLPCSSWPLFTLLSIMLVVLSLNTYMGADNTANAQSPTPFSPSSSTSIPAIRITSPQEGQQVPPGELTIRGISSDDENTDCRVYADVNDVAPMQNVTAVGDSKRNNDFSKWIFTYTPEYQLIKQGENELTAKITCSDERNPNTDALLLMSTSSAPPTSSSPLSKWHTVNVTGVVGATFITQPLPSAENTEDPPRKEIESEEIEEEDVDSDNVEVNNAGDNSEDNGDSFFSDDPFFD
jgi:hypothetical protein